MRSREDRPDELNERWGDRLRPWRDREALIEATEKTETCGEAGEYLGCNHGTYVRWLKNHGLERQWTIEDGWQAVPKDE